MTNSNYTWNNCKAFGDVFETLAQRWLTQHERWNTLPAYEIIKNEGKGPRLLTPERDLIAPDFFAMKYQKRKFIFKWFETKHKTRFTWYRKSRTWQTGINLKHYLDYIEVQKDTKVEVYVLFLHSGSEPSKDDLEHGSPAKCPTGLYGAPLNHLISHEHHRDPYDRGMVYWNESDLDKLATLQEVQTLPMSLWRNH